MIDGFHTHLSSQLSILRDVRSSSTKGSGCRRNFYSGFSACFLVPVWRSCIVQCKTELELEPPHIYVWNGFGKCKETLCSQQASWWTAFTHIYPSELSLWRDIRSSSTEVKICRRNFYSVFSVWFLVPVWSSCRFHCKSDLELVHPHIYVWSGVATAKKQCVPNKLCERRLSHTLIYQNWACGETFVHLAPRNGLQEKHLLWFLSLFPSAGLKFLQFSL